MRWPLASKLSALTAEKVPTPPVNAQLPDEMPLEMEMPLPPSTSGSTSKPPMRIALIAFIGPRLSQGRVTQPLRLLRTNAKLNSLDASGAPPPTPYLRGGGGCGQITPRPPAARCPQPPAPSRTGRGVRRDRGPGRLGLAWLRPSR